MIFRDICVMRLQSRSSWYMFSLMAVAWNRIMKENNIFVDCGLDIDVIFEQANVHQLHTHIAYQPTTNQNNLWMRAETWQYYITTSLHCVDVQCTFHVRLLFQFLVSHIEWLPMAILELVNIPIKFFVIYIRDGNYIITTINQQFSFWVSYHQITHKLNLIVANFHVQHIWFVSAIYKRLVSRVVAVQ